MCIINDKAELSADVSVDRARIVEKTFVLLFIGSKSLYCIYFGTSSTGFSVITSPIRNVLYEDENWNVSDELRAHSNKNK